eukprot:scaffold435_cov275-Chaetoceros_neogracile.AAC.13
MIKRDRQLLRSKTAHASVAGLLPSVLGNSPELLASSHLGGIDSASGLAYIMTSNDDDSKLGLPSSATIYIWKQDIGSLSEDIAPSDDVPILKFTHPHGWQKEMDDSSLGKVKKMVILAPSFSGVNYASSQRRNDNVYSGMSLYWASPDGLVCYWNDISVNGSDSDVSASLPLNLDNGEFVTYITFLDSTGAGSILIGTSMKRTFHVWKNARPLELQARLLLSDDLKESDGEGETSQGIFGGIYSKIFTPSKPKRPTLEENDPIALTKKAGIVGLFNYAASKQLFSPSKRSKHHHPNRDSQSFIYAIADDGIVDTWALEYDTDEGIYFGRHNGSINVKSVLKLNSGEILNEATIVDADIDTRPDSASIVVCIKAAVADAAGKNLYRYYMVHLPINMESGLVKAGDSLWLSRYSNDAISSTSNPVLCAGLVTALEQVEGEFSSVAYSVFQHMHRSGGHLPVTVSAVRFPTNGCSSFVDIDLDPHVIPHVPPGALQHDRATGGCNIISTVACMISVRATFPMNTGMTPEQLATPSKVNNEMVDVVAGHLFSAFQIHLRKQESQSNLPLSPRMERNKLSPYSKRSDSFLPPSIMGANGATLSHAVVTVSSQLVDQSSSSSGNAAALDVIFDKVQMHQSFIQYLVHAGIYKRVTFSGRLSLRDQGEMLYAIGGLLNSWNIILEAESRSESFHEALDQEGGHRNEITLFGEALKGIEQEVTQFPANFLSLQKRVIPGTMNGQPSSSTWLLFIMLKIHHQSIQNAVMHRNEQSEKLYDISHSEGSTVYYENGVSPWTSSNEALCNVEYTLQSLQIAAAENRNAAEILQQMNELLSEIVEHLVSNMLEGHKDVPASKRDEVKYNNAKNLAYVLLTAFCSAETAFELSLAHAYFLGVVELCHENSKHGKYHPRFDLISLIKDNDNAGGGCLSNDTDLETGLSFQKFVFCWHSDKGLFGTLLELGKHCQNVLSEYMEEDERLAHLRWIQNIKTGHFSKASAGLMSLSAEGLASFKTNSGHQSLKSRQLVLSLAKLSAMANGEHNAQAKNVQAIAEENLDLYAAQEALADMVDSYDVCARVMDPTSLMQLSMELTKSSDSLEDKVRASLAGLTIAKAMSSVDSIDNTTRQSHIAQVWALAIDTELNRWLNLLDDWSLLSDNDRASRIGNTVFYNMALQYYSDPTVKKNDEVGFTLVQDEVIKLLAIRQDGFSQMLQSTLSYCEQ